MKKRKHMLYPTLCLVVLLSGCSSNNSQDPPPIVNSPSTNLDPVAGDSLRVLDSEILPNGESAIRVLFLGDSITAGLGVGQEEAFPNLIKQKALKEGMNAVFIDAGVSGDTSTGGLNRIDWLLKSRIDVLILELGGNDGLRGVDLALTKENLSNIISKTKEAWPGVHVIVAGMQVPPNLGHEYTDQFKSIFPSIAAETGATLIPFILEGVGGVRELNQPDGIHPTAKGHLIVAETVWKALQPILRDKL